MHEKSIWMEFKTTERWHCFFSRFRGCSQNFVAPFEYSMEKFAMALPIIQKPLRKRKKWSFHISRDNDDAFIYRRELIGVHLSIATCGNDYSVPKLGYNGANIMPRLLFGLGCHCTSIHDIEISNIMKWDNLRTHSQKFVCNGFGLKLIEFAA